MDLFRTAQMSLAFEVTIGLRLKVIAVTCLGLLSLGQRKRSNVTLSLNHRDVHDVVLTH